MKELSLMYVRSSGMGYGRYGTYLSDTLEKMGYDIYDDLGDPPEFRSESYDEDKRESRRHKKTNVVCWVSVPTHARGWWDKQYKTISTMWESTRLPEAFRANLDNFDCVVVPSMQNLELFSKYHKNVQYVPLGVDPSEWFYVPRQTPGMFFNYLVCGSGARKGFAGDISENLPVKAFNKLWGKPGSWGDGPIPKLICKSPKGIEGEEWLADRIEVLRGRLSAEDERSLYASAHCMLAPSRGEGFGLQPLQGIAQGLPTVLTDAHGHESFANLGFPVSASFSKAEYFIYGDAGDWWEPNLDELCDQMKWVYDNYAAACDQAKQSAVIVANEFTWDLTAQKFVEAIGPEQFETPYQGTSKWEPSTERLYPLQVRKVWKADIAGIDYLFLPGKTYYEPADVKRIMYESELLEPTCLDLDGLLPQQVQKMERYSASQELCPTCGHAVNDGQGPPLGNWGWQ